MDHQVVAAVSYLAVTIFGLAVLNTTTLCVRKLRTAGGWKVVLAKERV